MNNPLNYDHLAFIVAAYGLFFAVTAWFAVGAQQRLKTAKRRIDAMGRK